MFRNFAAEVFGQDTQAGEAALRGKGTLGQHGPQEVLRVRAVTFCVCLEDWALPPRVARVPLSATGTPARRGSALTAATEELVGFAWSACCGRAGGARCPE